MGSLNKVIFLSSSPSLSSLTESCAVDSDCLGENEASEPAHGSAGSSPTELLLRLLHVATRGQTEYWYCISGGPSAPQGPEVQQKWTSSLFHYKPWESNLKPIKCQVILWSLLTPTAVLILYLKRQLALFRFWGRGIMSRYHVCSDLRNVYTNAHTVNKFYSKWEDITHLNAPVQIRVIAENTVNKSEIGDKGCWQCLSSYFLCSRNITVYWTRGKQ